MLIGTINVLHVKNKYAYNTLTPICQHPSMYNGRHLLHLSYLYLVKAKIYPEFRYKVKRYYQSPSPQNHKPLHFETKFFFFFLKKPVCHFISCLKKLVYIRSNYRIYNGWSFLHPCYKVICKLSMLCKAVSCFISFSLRVLDFNLV